MTAGLRTHTQTIRLGQRQLYAVVAGVQHYAQFVPWCVAARIVAPPTPAPAPGLERRASRLRAELRVGFNAFSERYTSDVTCVPLSSVRAVASNSALFKTLTTTWTLTPATDVRPRANPNQTANKSHADNIYSVSQSAIQMDQNLTSTQTPSKAKRKLTSADLLKFSSLHEPKIQVGVSPAISVPPLAVQDQDSASDHPICNVDFYIAFEFKSPIYAHASDLFFNQVCLAMVKSFEGRAREVYGPAVEF
ncbi:cyclase/dehydrase [Obelidium mucronatum]|nr:cyclase/dehydrase [Obelidium mucronatum]